ncbi:MAG: SDR family oxidoreductase [Chitinophagia bacterium]|jgi:NAD(P)-dependent dehydrogenase (short-subunit alcohol dehydrogenase family)
MNYQELFSLKGKVIVVTGGTGILGKAFIDGIIDFGGTAVIVGRNEEEGKKRADVINASGGQALFIKANVLDEKDIEHVRDTTLAAFGRIDGLVNGAGGNMPQGVIMPDKDVFDMNVEGLKNVLDLNLYGTIIPTKVIGAVMAKQENGGSIINISSVSSKQVITRVLGYSIGKAGVDCFTKWMAVETAKRHGDKIRVNSIMPGFFLTEQNRTLLTNPDGTYTERGNLVVKKTPVNRMGKPDELIGALVYLLSDASKFVNGTDIQVDGGFVAFGGV